MRYKQTFLGVTWAVLVPALTTTVYVIVFGKFANFPHGNTPYPALAAAGVIPMQYFAVGVTSSSMSLVSNLPLVTKVYFPRIMLPLARVVVPLVDFVIGLPVLLVVMAVVRHVARQLRPSLLAPAFMGLAIVTALGIGFLLSTLTARWRDVPYMIPVFLQILPLVSGVMYALDQIPEKWQWLFSLNPMSAVIAGWRWAMLGETAPQLGQTAVSVAVAIAALRRRSRRLPQLRAALRGHDLMPYAIEAHGALEALPHRPDAGRVRDAARLAGSRSLLA